jgi:hypothetical protein
MRHALVFALLFAACAAEHGPRPNVQVVAPRQLDRASISVDGQPASTLTTGNPFLEVLEQLLNKPRTVVTGLAHVANGTHTLRIVKQGFAPIERTVEVGDATVVRICPADVRPASP